MTDQVVWVLEYGGGEYDGVWEATMGVFSSPEAAMIWSDEYLQIEDHVDNKNKYKWQNYESLFTLNVENARMTLDYADVYHIQVYPVVIDEPFYGEKSIEPHDW